MSRNTSPHSSTLWAVLLIIGLLLTAPTVHAQSGPSLRSAERPIRVSLDPTYQYYDTSEDQTLTELSTYLTASVPIGQRFTVQARAGYAQMDAEQLESDQPTTRVRGLTDATGRLMYAQSVGQGSIVMSATVNVPVGKSKLESDELTTTRFISRNFYDFNVSSFSRGPSISPQVTYARPINDRLSVGIGASYQHFRGFQPRADLSSDYVPGDGIGGNVGANYKLTETSALGVDLAFRRYATDEIGGQPSFDAGNRFSGTVRYLRRDGFTTIRAVARYARWDESKFSYTNGAQQGQVIPSHVMLLGGYKTRLTEKIDLSIRASGYRYAEAEAIQIDKKIFGRAYVSPSFELTEQIAVAPHGTATYGSYLGLGGGLRIEGQF